MSPAASTTSRRVTELAAALLLVLTLGALVRANRVGAHNAAILTSEQAQLDSARATLRRRESDLATYRRVAHASRLAPNAVLEGADFATGRAVTIDLAAVDRPTALYSLDADCVYCMATLPFIRSLAACTSVLGVVVGDVDKLRHELARAPLPFPAVTRARGPGWDAVPFDGPTPLTVALGPGGHVRGLWTGLLDDSTKAQVRTTLGC